MNLKIRTISCKTQYKDSKKFPIKSLIVLLLLFLFECNNLSTPEKLDRFFTLKIKNAVLKVKLAISEEDKRKGLMFVKSLPENEGLLFIYSSPQPIKLWMKNTYIPLSAAFINSNGFIINIVKMKPLDTTSNYKSAAPAKFVLEVNQGWFEKNNIKEGDKVIFSEELKKIINRFK